MGLFNKSQKHPVIAVHDGKFHADDLFAAAVLSLVTGGRGEIVRTRDEKVIAAADYVADVGGINDPGSNRFDHHMPEGAGVHKNGIPYASFGLVWSKFGEELSGSEEVAEMVEQKLVSPIDADDNGVALTTPIGEVFPYGFQSFLATFRPTWREDAKMYDASFMELIPLVKKIICREIQIAGDALMARDTVVNAYHAAEDKRVVVLDGAYPFQETLSAFPEPLYIVAPRPGRPEWKVEAVRAKPYGFENRKPLPAAWAGLRDEELAKASGVSDAVFCHRACFLSVAKTRDGAIALAKAAAEAA